MQKPFSNVIRIFFVILAICISFCPVSTTGKDQQNKIAVIIHDNEAPDRHERVSHIEEILRFYKYQIHIITDVSEFRPFTADRVIVLYIGHGYNSTTPFFFFNESESEVAGFLQYIKAKELILISASCFSGAWMNLAQEGRVIISVTNMTLTISVSPKYSPYGVRGSIVNLLKTVYTLEVSLEEAYEIWVEEIIQPWYQCVSCLSWDYRESTMWHPLIYDGIKGDVML